MTIQHYLIGLQCYIRHQKDNALNSMVDIEFLYKLLGALYRRLHAQKIGCSMILQSLISLALIDKEVLVVVARLSPLHPSLP